MAIRIGSISEIRVAAVWASFKGGHQVVFRPHEPLDFEAYIVNLSPLPFGALTDNGSCIKIVPDDITHLEISYVMGYEYHNGHGDDWRPSTTRQPETKTRLFTKDEASAGADWIKQLIREELKPVF